MDSVPQPALQAQVTNSPPPVANLGQLGRRIATHVSAHHLVLLHAQRMLVQATIVEQPLVQHREELVHFLLVLAGNHIRAVHDGTLEDQIKGRCGVQQALMFKVNTLTEKATMVSVPQTALQMLKSFQRLIWMIMLSFLKEANQVERNNS